jgi:hypothetical protein
MRPLVQALIALGLAGLIVGVHQRFNRRVREVRAHERLLARRWPAAVVAATLPVGVRSTTPLERWGAQRWQRPPPALLVV